MIIVEDEKKKRKS